MNKIANVDELSEGSFIAYESKGLDLLVGLAEGRYFAVENLCPHAMVPMNTPYLQGCILTCPWHGLGFDVHTGECESWPGMDQLTRVPIIVRDGEIFLAPSGE